MNAQLKPMGRKELLLGCGGKREKFVSWEGVPEKWTNLVTLDIEARHKPDVIHDLDVLPYPFADNEFDEIHAYEVLEHTGTQGDYKFFFAQFTEFHRMLKPGGFFVGSCPMWDQVWAWGDPGHRRVISNGTLMFLEQKFYADQVGKTAATDYRDIYKADFRVMNTHERGPQFFFALQAIK